FRRSSRRQRSSLCGRSSPSRGRSARARGSLPRASRTGIRRQHASPNSPCSGGMSRVRLRLTLRPAALSSGIPMRTSLAILLLLAASSVPLPAQTPRDSGTTIIRAGHLFDSETGAFLSAREILVRGGQIVQVAEKVEHPAGARVVDLSKYTVLPGLIDAHTHLLYLEGIGGNLTMEALKALVNEGLPLRALHGAARARTFLEAGITTVRDLGNSGKFGDLSLRHAIDDGSLDGPRMIVSGPGLSSIGGQFPGLVPGYEGLAAD